MAPTKGPSGPQFLVIALTALGLLVCLQVLRVTATHSGSMSAFATRDALSLQQRALGALGAAAAASGARPAARVPLETLAAQQPTLASAPTAADPLAPAGLRSCTYQRASPLLAPGPHTVGVPLADVARCPSRSPYHTLLTAQTSTYQQWQSRIMYYHWKKQRAADGPCTDMTGFTRLAAAKGGAPDGLEALIPTIFIEELPEALIRAHFGFGVLNRPHSVKVLLQTPALAARIEEDFVFIAETDHVFTRPLPNLATATTPIAFEFGYMHAGPATDWVVKRYWPEGDWRRVQPIGPSPALISKAQLALIVDDWLSISLHIRSNADAESVIQGWVQEMWGYSIAAAKRGVEHKAMRELQIETGATRRTFAPDFWAGYRIFHYTYGLEWTLTGQPQGINQIGEWSLDKRHYGGAYPPADLEPPPAGATAPTCWLLQAWNEAMASEGSGWPASKAFGTVGWRRDCSPPERVRAHPIGSKLVGTAWTWAGIPGLEFGGTCEVKTPWGTGKWGLQPVSRECDAACSASRVFLDFSGALHTLVFDADVRTFESTRVGDGEKVRGVRRRD